LILAARREDGVVVRYAFDSMFQEKFSFVPSRLSSPLASLRLCEYDTRSRNVKRHAP